MSSYLATISSTTSTNLSGEIFSAHSPTLKPKSKFITSYGKLLDQITESVKTNRQKEEDFLSSLQPKNEKEHLKTFSANIEKRKTNPFQQEIFKAKLSLLAGSTLDSMNFSRKKEKEVKTSRNNNKIPTYESSSKTNVAFKELKHYLKKNNDLPVSSKLFKNDKKSDNEKMFDTFCNTNNNFIAKIRQTFPEYINIRTKGQSFIMNSNGGANSKINQLRRQVNKL